MSFHFSENGIVEINDTTITSKNYEKVGKSTTNIKDLISEITSEEYTKIDPTLPTYNDDEYVFDIVTHKQLLIDIFNSFKNNGTFNENILNSKEINILNEIINPDNKQCLTDYLKSILILSFDDTDEQFARKLSVFLLDKEKITDHFNNNVITYKQLIVIFNFFKSCNSQLYPLIDVYFAKKLEMVEKAIEDGIYRKGSIEYVKGVRDAIKNDIKIHHKLLKFVVNLHNTTSIRDLSIDNIITEFLDGIVKERYMIANQRECSIPGNPEEFKDLLKPSVFDEIDTYDTTNINNVKVNILGMKSGVVSEATKSVLSGYKKIEEKYQIEAKKKTYTMKIYDDKGELVSESTFRL